MKRSQINKALKDAMRCFDAAQWALPPNPRWDVTDCGLGRFNEVGLVLLNLAEQPEYCEKLMYSKRKQVTPMHTHGKKRKTSSAVAAVWPLNCGKAIRDRRQR